MRKYAESLVTETEAIKLFMKEQFYLPKKSVSEINCNTDTELNVQNYFVNTMNFYHMKTHQKIL